MTQGRKIRFELTPLEAEAVVFRIDGSGPWNRFERKRGPTVAKAALARVLDKIWKEISRS